MILLGFILGVLLCIMHVLEVYAKLKNFKWQTKNGVFYLNLAIYVIMTLLVIIADYKDQKEMSSAIVLAFLIKEICVQIIAHILDRKSTIS